MTWRYGPCTVEHALPIGALTRAPEGAEVMAGDVIARGSVVGAVQVVPGAHRVGVAARDLDRVLRVRPVADVHKGAILARTGRRFARAATSPIEGRLIHITADGDLYVAPVIDDWRVRATIDGTVSRSDDAVVEVRGECWSLAGLAAYGPDAIGELALGVDGPDEPLAPTRIDVRLRDRVVVGGARIAAEAITRAHACGVSGLVAGAAPAGGLRTVFGDDIDARGRASFEDRPTVLCLVGFGSGPLPAAVWDPLVELAGERASIHTASARLFVLAPSDRATLSEAPALLALDDDHGSVRPLDPEERPLTANVLPFDAAR
jgi:hypothetical protein